MPNTKHPAYGSYPSEPKIPDTIPDRLSEDPRIEIPLTFNLYPTAIPPIGPSGDNTVAPKAGGAKNPPQGAAPSPSGPNAGFLKQHGLG